jgi:hypothetical protein
MDFPAEELTYFKIWSSDFNDFVVKHFGTEYHYADTMEFPGQDTYFEYSIGDDSCGEDYHWDEETNTWKDFDKNAFLNDLYSKPSTEKPAPSDILEYLYQIGEIPAGKYLFTIWW